MKSPCGLRATADSDTNATDLQARAFAAASAQQRALQLLDDLLGPLLDEAVVGLVALLDHVHQPQLAEDAQVTAGRGLADASLLGQVAHGEGELGETADEHEEQQPGGIAEGLQAAGQVGELVLLLTEEA